MANDIGTNEDDLELNQLARKAQQYPDRSYERRRALNLLANKIFQSTRLIRPPSELPPAVSEDLYREALNITVMEICKNIDKYDSSRDILGWINFVLRRRFTDQKRQWRLKDCLPFDIGDLDDRLMGEWTPSNSASNELKQFIEEDPDGVFTNTHISRNPRATFQFLVLARIWEDRKWEDISTELQVAKSTLCEFFKKQLQELKPYFENYFSKTSF